MKQKTNFKTLLGERVLVISKQRRYSSSTEIEELKILELSPSESYVKVQNQYGNKIWKSTQDITPVEILLMREKHPEDKN